MAIEEVGARLSLKDKPAFSRGLRDAEGDVDRLGRSADKAGRNFSVMGRLASGARGGISALGSIARSAAIGVGVLTGAAIAGGIALVDMASDAAEVESKFNTVFGPNGSAQVADWMAGVQSSVHIATDELQDAASTFGVFGQAIGVPASELAGFSTALAEAGLDLASFANADPSDVFLALRSGLAGESEPLRQFGIFLSDASLNAFALEQGIAKTTSEMTEQEKVMLRQRFILSNLGAAQGDLARTAEGAANAKRSLFGVLRDMRVEIGSALLPAVETLLPVLTEGLQGVLGRISEGLPDLQQRIRNWSGSLVRLFRTIRNGRVDTTGFDEQIAAVFGTRLGGFINDAIDLFGNLRSNIDELGTRQGSIVTVSAMFGADAGEILETIWRVAGDIGTVFRDTLVPAWQGAVDAVGPLAGATGRAFVEVLEFAADNAERLAPWMEAIFVTYITSSAVNTVFRMAAAMRALAVGLGMAGAAGAGGAAAGGGAGLLSRLLPWIGGAGAGAAGLATAGVGAAAGGVVAAAHHFGDADRYPELAPIVAGGGTEPQPQPGEAPTPMPSGGSRPVAVPMPSGHDSWRTVGDGGVGPGSVVLSPTFNVAVGPSTDREYVDAIVRRHGRVFTEGVQRELEISRSRD